MVKIENTSVLPNHEDFDSSVEEIEHRNIESKVRLHLFVVAGGHCEFRGCCDYLMEHHLTGAPGNFSQTAHIVAFKRKGPRGNVPDRPEINNISNLMLLCHKCHKLIDDNPKNYKRGKLEEMKQEHEERIRLVTSLGPNMRTALVTFQAPIGGQHINIPADDIRKALSPRFPTSYSGTAINLSSLAGSTEMSTLDVAQQLIQSKLNILFQTGGEAEKVGHISVFAIGPIATLIALGSKLSNKIPTDFYQRHRDTEDWAWKIDGNPAQYEFIRRIEGPTNGPVALMLSLSGTIDISKLPNEFIEGGSVYEIILKGQAPNPTFLNQRIDLEAFRIVYQESLGAITNKHSALDKIAIFPAVPAPVAILCGRERLPKVHPVLSIYDFDKNEDGFNFQLEVS